MGFHIVGLGLVGVEDLTVRARRRILEADLVYIEAYTSPVDLDTILSPDGPFGPVTLLTREQVEDGSILLEGAVDRSVALLVGGDPLSATTHVDLLSRCRERGITYTVDHAPSIVTAAAGISGLQLYKFGRTASLPYPYKGVSQRSPMDVIRANLLQGLHTLILLDLGDGKDPMPARTAIDILLDIDDDGMERPSEVIGERPVLVCSRLGSDDQVEVGTLGDLSTRDHGLPPHCLIVPGSMHFQEVDFLKALPGGDSVDIPEDEGPSPHFLRLLRYGPKSVVTTDGVVIDGGKVLLIERDRPPFEGSFALPGGFLDYDERGEDGVVREVREETGLETRVVDVVGIYSDPGRDPRHHTVTLAYLLERTGGTLEPGDDAADAGFYPLDDLPEMAFDHAGIIGDALRRYPHLAPGKDHGDTTSGDNDLTGDGDEEAD